MAYVLGVDIGTEGTKVVVINEAGEIIQKAYRSYSFEVPQNGWAEQHPEIWWDAFRACLAELWDAGIQSSDVLALGVAGQMHSSVLLDASGQVVMTSILWNDGRTKAICDETLNLLGREAYQSLTCNSLLPGFTLGKLLWVREHQRETYERIRHVLMPKDYINYRLTGVYSADVSDASGTGVFDVRNRTWNEELLVKLDLPRAWFPPVHESGDIVGSISSAASEITGLHPDTVVIAGAADNAAAAVGMGIIKRERGLVSVGTSGVVLGCLEQPPNAEQAATQNPTLHVFCHAIPGMWYGMGVTLAAGASLKWFRDSLGHNQSYDALMDEAATVADGSDGLTYLPFLTGERTPYNSDKMRAGFLGMHMGHKPAHFVRSVIEGVSYSLRDCLDIVQSVSDNIDEFTVTGGAVNSGLWLQVLSDVLDAPLTVPDYSEGAALGVAYLAGVVKGLWSSVDEALPSEEAMHRVQPSENRELYKSRYQEYKTYAQALQDIAKRSTV